MQLGTAAYFGSWHWWPRLCEPSERCPMRCSEGSGISEGARRRIGSSPRSPVAPSSLQRQLRDFSWDAPKPALTKDARIPERTPPRQRTTEMKQTESKHGKGAGARIPEYPKPCLAVITVMNSALSWRSSPRRGNQLPRPSRCRSASCKQVRVKHRYRKIRLYCGVLFIRLIPMRYMNHGPVVPMYLCTRGHNPKGQYTAPFSSV